MSRHPDERAAIEFGEHVARQRRLQVKSRPRLAQQAGIPSRDISRIEAGLCDPNLSMIVRLARALDVRAGRLIEGPPKRPPHLEDIVLDSSIYVRLGEMLRQERRRLGLRQDDVALASGLGLRAVGEIEAGKPTARFATWLAIIEALSFKLVVVHRSQSSP